MNRISNKVLDVRLNSLEEKKELPASVPVVIDDGSEENTARLASLRDAQQKCIVVDVIDCRVRPDDDGL